MTVHIPIKPLPFLQKWLCQYLNTQLQRGKTPLRYV